MITNADAGAAVFAQALQYQGVLCNWSEQGSLFISYVSKDGITSQITSTNTALVSFIPALQREDGSYIGTDYAGDLRVVGLDGNQVWSVAYWRFGSRITPLYATADGGVIVTTTPQCSQPVVNGTPCSPGPLGNLFTIDKNGR